MSDETLTSSFRVRDVPEVPVVNLTYENPRQLSSGYVLEALPDVPDA